VSPRLQVGDEYRATACFSQEQVRQFTELSGDKNPIHLDPEVAARTPFGRPIVPGMLSAAAFTRVFGMEFPGHGTIYLTQSLRFRRPLFVGETYVVRCKVLSTEPERHRAVIETVIEDGGGEVCLTGEASLLNPDRL